MNIHIILLFELVLLLVYLIFVLNKKLFNKDNIVFAVPLFIINVLINIYAINYYNDFDGLISVLNAITWSVEMFAFKYAGNFDESIFINNEFFLSVYLIAYVLSGLTLVSSIIGLARSRWFNYLKRTFKLHFTSPDIVLGDNEDAIEYLKNNKNSIMVFSKSISSQIKNTSKKEIFSNLYDLGIPFIDIRKVSINRLKRLSICMRKNINVISFIDGKENLNLYYDILNDSNSRIYKKNISLFVNVSARYKAYVESQLSKEIKDKSINNILIFTFDKYELIAKNFTEKFNLCTYLPTDSNSFIDENGALKDKKKINVVVIGMGKTNYSVIKSTIMNNQFVTYDNNRLKNALVNYYIYDKKDVIENIDYINAIINKRYEAFIDDKIKPIEPLANIIVSDVDINSLKFSNELLSHIKTDMDTFTYYFVGLSSSIENCAMAEQIALHANPKNSFVFYVVDSQNDAINNKSIENIAPYGLKTEIFNHDSIVNSSLFEMACANDKMYSILNNNSNVYDEKNYKGYDCFTRNSNFTAILNIPFKTSLLGYTFVDKDSPKYVDRDEFVKKYNSVDTCNINVDNIDYLSISKLNVLLFEEHSRWNAYYTLNGFVQMPLSKINVKVNNGSVKVENKNIEKRQHSCLTSYYELDKVNNHVNGLIDNLDITQEVKDEYYKDYYKYDCQTVVKIMSALGIENKKDENY